MLALVMSYGDIVRKLLYMKRTPGGCIDFFLKYDVI